MIKRSHSVVFGLIIYLLLGSASAAVPLDRVIAIVNSQVITQTQLNEAIALVKPELEHEHISLAESELQKQVLDKLILRNLQLQLATRYKITVSDTELKTAIDKIASNNHLTVTQLYEVVARQQNMTEKQFRNQIQDEMVISKLQQRAVAGNVHVADQEVKDFLRTAPKRSAETTEYHLMDILVPLAENPTPAQIDSAKQKAENLLRQLRTGADFAKLAMTNSTGSEAVQGGDLGWRKAAELPDIFAQKIVSMQAGNIAGPVQAPNGFHLLKLAEVKNNNKPLTEADAKNAVFQRKFEDQLQTWLQQVRHSAFVKIML